MADSAPFLIQERSGQPCNLPDGYLDPSGRVLGTYLHGLFHNQELRRALLRALDTANEMPQAPPVGPQQDPYDALADLVRQSLDMDLIYQIAALKAPK